ncbi:MAG: hypothetical protein GX640_05655 [Fibrobacter sp.]|nr:hypothetical protein [Fibrobacter sp.]
MVNKKQVHGIYRNLVTSGEKSKMTAEEWKEIWLKKYDRVIENEGQDFVKGNNARMVITRFLEKCKGSPYYIKIPELIEYLDTLSDKQKEVLRYFCEKIAISERHSKPISEMIVSKNENPSRSTMVGNANTNDRNQKTVSKWVQNKYQNNADQNFSPEERVELLNKLKIEIKARNLSNRTLKSYFG